MSTTPLSKAKFEQIAELLTNKFRTKFKIHPIKEAFLLDAIKLEVIKLLNSGKTYEKNLVHLEKALAGVIATARSNEPTSPKECDNDVFSVKSRATNAEAQSQVGASVRSKSQSIGVAGAKRVVYHLDPA